MAVPKQKKSKASTRTRKSVNMKLTPPRLVACGTCGNKVLPHRVCPKCGYYRGRQVIETEDIG